jgi:hypothetical protein
VLDGATLAGVADEMVLLVGWGVVAFGVALKLFRWR